MMKKYIPYLKASGGGITVTGGEPLMQLDFLTELFMVCKELNIHTTIDTNGFIEKDKDTGKSFLKIPVPDEDTISKAVITFSRLLQGLRK